MSNQTPAVRYEFILPNVYFGGGDEFTTFPSETPMALGVSGLRDILSFEIEGKLWSLRDIFDVDGEAMPADVAYHRKAAAFTGYTARGEFKHAELQVDATTIADEEAAVVADNICWLLGLALCQQVSWGIRLKRENFNVVSRSGRHIFSPLGVSKKQALLNNKNGTIKNYLEKAYPIFKQDVEWWRVSLHWFSLSCEQSLMEGAGMVNSMLLDRLSTKVLKDRAHNFGNLIGADLAGNLADPGQRKLFTEVIDGVIRPFAAAWPIERSKSLVETIAKWNVEPSFPKKIATAYQLVGLAEPPRVVTGARHKLMHVGKMEGDIAQYHTEAHKAILGLMLKMLGYDGEFFSPVTWKG